MLIQDNICSISFMLFLQDFRLERTGNPDLNATSPPTATVWTHFRNVSRHHKGRL